MTLRITNHEGTWAPYQFHSAYDAPIVWKQTPQGILVRGEESERRTRGEPTTLRRIWGQYGDVIRSVLSLVSAPRGVDGGSCVYPLILAVIAAESRGNPTAERHEPHLHDYSIGLTQVLTATAHDLARTAPFSLLDIAQLHEIANEKTLPQGGSLERWRALLQEPTNAVALAVWYLLRASRDGGLQFDPVLCYAAYNAGSVRENISTPWGLHYYRKVDNNGKVVADAMDSFVKWYGDACHVYYLNP